MKLIRCGIKDLRNIKDAEIEFSDGLNLIRGNNAQGKTTVLEAVYIFARGRSFRTNKEAEFISFDSDTSEISILITDRGISDEQRKAIEAKGVKVIVA